MNNEKSRSESRDRLSQILRALTPQHVQAMSVRAESLLQSPNWVCRQESIASAAPLAEAS